MKVKDLQQTLELELLAGENGLDREVDGCYIGDLLSWVMGRADPGNIWLTVMGNINAIAVARLGELGCVVLCDGAMLDSDAKEKADDNDIPVLFSEQPSYTLAIKIAELLKHAV